MTKVEYIAKIMAEFHGKTKGELIAKIVELSSQVYDLSNRAVEAELNALHKEDTIKKVREAVGIPAKPKKEHKQLPDKMDLLSFIQATKKDLSASEQQYMFVNTRYMVACNCTPVRKVRNKKGSQVNLYNTCDLQAYFNRLK